MLEYVKPLSRTYCYITCHCQTVHSITWLNDGCLIDVGATGAAVCHLGIFVHSLRRGYYQEVIWGPLVGVVPNLLWCCISLSISFFPHLRLCHLRYLGCVPVGACSCKCHRHSLRVSWRPCCDVETHQLLDGVNQSDAVQTGTHQYHLDYCRCWVLRLCGSILCVFAVLSSIIFRSQTKLTHRSKLYWALIDWVTRWRPP